MLPPAAASPPCAVANPSAGTGRHVADDLQHGRALVANARLAGDDVDRRQVATGLARRQLQFTPSESTQTLTPGTDDPVL